MGDKAASLSSQVGEEDWLEKIRLTPNVATTIIITIVLMIVIFFIFWKETFHIEDFCFLHRGRRGMMVDKAASLPTLMGEKEWLQKMGLAPNIGTKMAYAIIFGSKTFAKSREEMDKNFGYFMKLLGEASRYRLYAQVSSWRLPVYNLSLIQLAAVCGNVLVYNQLFRHHCSGRRVWPEDMDPRDDGEPCENHPLHLMYAYGQYSSENACDSGNFRFKKGSVTVALNPSFTPEAPVVLLDMPLYGSCLDLAFQNKHVSLVLDLVPDYFKVLEKTNIVPAIECLWLALDLIQESGQIAEIRLNNLMKYFDRNSEVHDNLFLLCCQLLNAHEWKVSSKTCSTNSEILMALVSEAVSNKRQDMLTLAARYCSQAQLHLVARILEYEIESIERPQSTCEYYCSLYPPEVRDVKACILKAFQKEQKVRTLQHEAVLAILRSEGGDARWIEISLGLPKPLLDLVRVPFKGLYDQLTGSTQ